MARPPHPEWTPLLEELERRREVAMASGGPERVAREHRYNRSTARERILKLVDAGSFLEVGTFVTTPTKDGALLASTFVCGLAEIDGRSIAIGAEDFSVEGGGTGVHLPRYKGGWTGFIEDFALGYRIPLVLLINGVGGSVILQDAVGYPQLQAAISTAPMFEIMDKVPVLTAVLGPTAGSSAARAYLSHFSVMTKDNGCMFAGGPPVVKQALGLEIDKFALGGVDIHVAKSGLIDNQAADEDDALSMLRQVFSYLPDNVGQRSRVEPKWAAEDQEEVLAIVSPSPRRIYDAQALIRCVADQGSFFEIGPDYGRSVRVGFARLEGHTVGMIASDNRFLAGSLDVASSLKQTKFTETCDRFHIPIVYFADVPGFLVGPKAEEAGVLRFGSMALRAIQQAQVPVFTVQVRRSYGLGGVATGNANPMSLRLAWPSAMWGDMPIEGGIEAAFRAQLDAAPPEERPALKVKLTKQYEAQTSVWKAMENFAAEEMIDPRATRGHLVRLVKLYYQRPFSGPAA
jgi:acetyl-CoA carboxylase carboxyltransferase component